MRKIMWRIISLAIILLLAGCLNKPAVPPKQAAPSVMNPPKVSLDEKRRTQYTAWMEGYYRVADYVKDRETDKIRKFIEDHEIFAILREKSLGFLTKQRKKDRLAILALLQEDAVVNPIWTERPNSDIEAGYIENYRIVRFFPGEVSPVWRGIMAGHEFFHAYDHAQHKYQWPATYTSSGKVELRAYLYQFKLQWLRGGPKYHQWIDKTIAHMKGRLARNKAKVGDEFPMLSGYDTALDEAFGPALSDNEREDRMSQCWMHACWIMLDREHTNPEKIKLELIQQSYSSL
jgi:hypothetical protein